MGLEQEIKQKEFKNEYQKALINLLYTRNHLVSRMNDIFKKYQVTRQQYNVLRILRGQYPKPATINLIKDRMLDKMSDASRIVKRLYKKDLIERKQSINDGRVTEVIISNKGLELLQRMNTASEEFEGFFSTLTEEEARTLNSLLDNLRKS